MTDDEVWQLYMVIMAYDNRKPSETNVAAWREQAQRGRWTLPEAVEAVHEHHAKSEKFLMPVHINEIIRANLRQPEPVKALLARTAHQPASPQHIAKILTGLAAELGWSERKQVDGAPVAPELAVPCPLIRCRADVGEPCFDRITAGPHRGSPGPARDDIHDERATLLAERTDP